MIDKFLRDEQDPKAVEKVYSRLVDLLTTSEEIIYIAVQKKPIVNLFPDCIAITNKRLLFFTPANLGLSIKFVDFVWKDIIDVYTKEEIIGAVFSAKTTIGTEMGVDYLPKVQARKLYQYAQERKEAEREARRLRELEEKRAESGSLNIDHASQVAFQPVAQQSVAAPTPQPAPIAPVEEPKKDELTEKLKRLKTLFESGLISQEEYNHKKLELLSDF
ncbi:MULTISPECIES: PH domain-containing protein [unclassified Mucilaginibacter]|uniref:PH domain-containing protein n=1 Tax=unclassified Mucilaginibacter TaxID=2617802 RepID=UPI002AC8BF79|nr:MULTISPECIES: PH domain-containing protein [unclassified Mucilaginibacter]MEB0277065.1 PH domain-containing protein [Mucilaginibacter sp. 10B2]MEB0302187.1 PH domain-containing protein [Mucilaginibacter sp. 5C4]WPX25166.1 PH domain-containing protein [Mucilaginibacter sp. 5C4]